MYKAQGTRSRWLGDVRNVSNVELPTTENDTVSFSVDTAVALQMFVTSPESATVAFSQDTAVAFNATLKRPGHRQYHNAMELLIVLLTLITSPRQRLTVA
jgi:hypothetical protein